MPLNVEVGLKYLVGMGGRQSHHGHGGTYDHGRKSILCCRDSQ